MQMIMIMMLASFLRCFEEQMSTMTGKACSSGYVLDSVMMVGVTDG